jgi:hypothetical protein
MELRRKFGRFVVDPKPAQLADRSGWIPEFSLEEHLASRIDDTMFFSKQVFSTREEAIQACYELGRRQIVRRLALLLPGVS